jgi:Flp pilus assembly protein TadG
MTPALRQFSDRLRQFARCEDATATIEFVILFPPIMLIFMSAVEAGVYMTRNAQLERGLDLAVRDIRIGTPVPPTFQQFRQSICDVAKMVPNCMETLQVELQVVDSSTWQPLDPSPRCVDRNSPIDPFDEPDYNVGGNNDFMLVRLCSNVDPVLPGIGLGLLLDSDGANGYAIVATTAFVNEPSR